MDSSFLRLQSVTVYVRDQDLSARFYVDQLGFKLIADTHLPDGNRWVVVGPSENPAMLALVTPTPDSENYKLIGRNTEVIFLAEDVYGKLAQWEKQGVQFRRIPLEASWSGAFATFEDPDGNSFGLVGFAVRESWKSPGKSRLGCSPNRSRPLQRSTIRAFAFRPGRLAAITMTS
jgi:catechol 2,3-dioxygenase-like lactoylglutathione lyase family enzyme